jgi:FkbM family methyltransferase
MRLLPRLTTFGSTSIYIKRDNYEPELLAIRQFISDGDIVLDIGGSFGIYSLFMSTYVGPNGKVYAFEPGLFSYAQLTANVLLNHRERRIITYQVAASDRAHALRLNHVANSPVNFSIGLDETNEHEVVRGDRVDSFVSETEQGNVSFIKIDVEGYERTALEGARKIVEKSRPTILFEVSSGALQRQGLTPDDVYSFLASFHYKFYALNAWNNLVEIAGTPEGNIFALPDANVRPHPVPKTPS